MASTVNSTTNPVLCKNSKCRSPLSVHVRSCEACEADAGFPNVRACETEIEQQALETRYKRAKREARSRRAIGSLEEFEKSLNDSRAIICKDIAVLVQMLNSDNYFYVSYYKQVESGYRSPEGNIWDRTRESGDAVIFPNYHREIIFAALALGIRGVSDYGNTTIILKDSMMDDRSSVFETNTFNFARDNNLSSGTETPPGYRATWAQRAKLAVAKLGPTIQFADTVREFPDRLLGDGEGKSGDFIEVHVYGKINRRAIEKVVFATKGMRRADRILTTSLKNNLKKVGIAVEDKR